MSRSMICSSSSSSSSLCSYFKRWNFISLLLIISLLVILGRCADAQILYAPSNVHQQYQPLVLKYSNNNNNNNNNNKNNEQNSNNQRHHHQSMFSDIENGTKNFNEEDIGEREKTIENPAIDSPQSVVNGRKYSSTEYWTPVYAAASQRNVKQSSQGPIPVGAVTGPSLAAAAGPASIASGPGIVSAGQQVYGSAVSGVQNFAGPAAAATNVMSVPNSTYAFSESIARGSYRKPTTTYLIQPAKYRHAFSSTQNTPNSANGSSIGKSSSSSSSSSGNNSSSRNQTWGKSSSKSRATSSSSSSSSKSSKLINSNAMPIPMIKPHRHGATLGFNLPDQGLTLYLDINELATKPMAQNIGLKVVAHGGGDETGNDADDPDDQPADVTSKNRPNIDRINEIKAASNNININNSNNKIIKSSNRSSSSSGGNKSLRKRINKAIKRASDSNATKAKNGTNSSSSSSAGSKSSKLQQAVKMSETKHQATNKKEYSKFNNHNKQQQSQFGVKSKTGDPAAHHSKFTSPANRAKARLIAANHQQQSNGDAQQQQQVELNTQKLFEDAIAKVVVPSSSSNETMIRNDIPPTASRIPATYVSHQTEYKVASDDEMEAHHAEDEQQQQQQRKTNDNKNWSKTHKSAEEERETNDANEDDEDLDHRENEDSGEALADAIKSIDIKREKQPTSKDGGTKGAAPPAAVGTNQLPSPATVSASVNVEDVDEEAEEEDDEEEDDAEEDEKNKDEKSNNTNNNNNNIESKTTISPLGEAGETTTTLASTIASSEGDGEGDAMGSALPRVQMQHFDMIDHQDNEIPMMMIMTTSRAQASSTTTTPIPMLDSVINSSSVARQESIDQQFVQQMRALIEKSEKLLKHHHEQLQHQQELQSPSTLSSSTASCSESAERCKRSAQQACQADKRALTTESASTIREIARQLDADHILDQVSDRFERSLQRVVDFSSPTSTNPGYTIVLPSNDAIRRLPPSLMRRLKRDQDDEDAVGSFYPEAYVLDGSHTLQALLERAKRSGSIRARAKSVRWHVSNAHNTSHTINGQRVLIADQRAPNGGLVHVIDGLLYPQADRDIMQTLKACGRLDGFVTLAEGTGFANTLKQDGPFTLFVPSNEALQKVPDNDLELIRRNMTALREFLKYHVAHGVHYSQDLIDGQFLPSLVDGEYLQAGVRVDGCSRRLVEVNVSPLYRADIPASNGVIHVVDWILKPDDRDWCNGVILPHRR